MYERTGMGWETIYETNWLGGRTENPSRCMELVDLGVPGGEAEQRCFKENEAERYFADQSGCARIGWPCETGGESGSTWCCPPGIPDHQLPEGQVTAGDLVIHQPQPPTGGDPNPVAQHTFFTRLTHPGAIAAILVFGVVSYLGVRSWVASEKRQASYV